MSGKYAEQKGRPATVCVGVDEKKFDSINKANISQG